MGSIIRNTIGLAESFFYVDSEFIIHIIENLQKEKDPDIKRWHLALILFDQTLDIFKFCLEEKRVFSERLAKNCQQEFHMSSHSYTKVLNDRFRLYTKQIEVILNNKKLDGFDYYIELFKFRGEQSNKIANEIFTIQEKGMLEVNIENLASSFIHMSLNRLFRTNSRKSEMVIYYYMSKYYNRLHAMASNKNSPK